MSGIFAQDFSCCFNASQVIDAIAEYVPKWTQSTNDTQAAVAVYNENLVPFRPKCTCNQETQDIDDAAKNSQGISTQTAQINDGIQITFDQVIAIARLAERIAHSERCQCACDALGKLINSTTVAVAKINTCQQDNHNKTISIVEESSCSLNKICPEKVSACQMLNVEKIVYKENCIFRLVMQFLKITQRWQVQVLRLQLVTNRAKPDTQHRWPPH